MSRKLKSLNIFFDVNQVPQNEIENLPNFKETIYGELYDAIKESSNKDIASLVEINNTGYIIDLHKDGWIPALEEAVIFLEKKEEYEKCRLYKTLIEQIHEQRNQSNSRSSQQVVKRQNTNKKEGLKKDRAKKGNIYKTNRGVGRGDR